jgi:phosphoribosyl 1,2-cyclic phosphodiesterase
LKIKYSPSARDKLRQIKLVSGTKITGTIVEGINDEVIYITDIYSERENFMWKMFGISLRSQESIDFWDE